MNAKKKTMRTRIKTVVDQQSGNAVKLALIGALVSGVNKYFDSKRVDENKEWHQQVRSQNNVLLDSIDKKLSRHMAHDEHQ